MIDAADIDDFARCIAGGEVVVFPADTVYGLACDPQAEEAVERLYALKGRRPEKPAAVMFFTAAAALEKLPELGPRTRTAVSALIPGPVTLLLPNPREHFPLACRPDTATLGLRVPRWPQRLAALGALSGPVLQSSANRSGGADARRLRDVPAQIRAGAGLVLDGGELPGLPSSVIDLRAFERGREWRIVRAGAMPSELIESALA